MQCWMPGKFEGWRLALVVEGCRHAWLLRRVHAQEQQEIGTPVESSSTVHRLQSSRLVVPWLVGLA